jgi:hypothetical protein
VLHPLNVDAPSASEKRAKRIFAVIFIPFVNVEGQ